MIEYSKLDWLIEWKVDCFHAGTGLIDRFDVVLDYWLIVIEIEWLPELLMVILLIFDRLMNWMIDCYDIATWMIDWLLVLEGGEE